MKGAILVVGAYLMWVMAAEAADAKKTSQQYGEFRVVSAEVLPIIGGDFQQYKIELKGVHGEKMECPLDGSYEIKVQLKTTPGTHLSYRKHHSNGRCTISVGTKDAQSAWESMIERRGVKDVVPKY